MILSQQAIKNAIEVNQILVSPYLPQLVKNQSIDVRLGRWVYVQRISNHPTNFWYDLDSGTLRTRHDEFYIAHTEEFIGTAPYSDILPSFKLKSSAGRAGIIHTLAGHGDVGFFNRWALEFTSVARAELHRYMAIGQIYFSLTTKSGSYAEETGSYQSTDDFDLLQKNWDKETILPKPLKVIT